MPTFKDPRLLTFRPKYHTRTQCRTLPKLIFIIDDINFYQSIIFRLPPKESMLILRMYQHPERSIIARDIVSICKKRQIKLLIAGDPYLAQKIQADGIHISQTSFYNLRGWRHKMNNWIITAAAHDFKRLLEIKNHDLTAALYSPVFNTTSHPKQQPIGPMLFAKHVNTFTHPIYALGGINKNNINQLKHIDIVGIAGISIFHHLVGAEAEPDASLECSKSLT